VTAGGFIPPVDTGDWPQGWTVEWVAATASTNDDVLATADRRPDRSALAAGHQTAGRGRLGRRWDAPAGTNLLVSLLFQTVPDEPGELTRRVGLAAVAACRDVAGAEAVLKWPNDVLISERKVAGILAQVGASGAVAVGLGLNVGWAPHGAARLGDGIDPLTVLRSLLAAFDALPADVTPMCHRALSTLGRRVRVERLDGATVGVATDVEADGRLVVVDDCAITHRFHVGDVVHLRGTDVPEVGQG